jgi:magnesium chelatase family protein
LLDRIDIHIDVPAVKYRELRSTAPTENSAAIRERIVQARQRQLERFAVDGIYSNAQMAPKLIRKYCEIDTESEKLLETAITRLGLSARAHDRILKVARTIADLEGSEQIQPKHISEAVQYRTLDRTYWT